MGWESRVRLVGEGVEAGGPWVYFHLSETKRKLYNREGPRSSSFLLGQDNTERALGRVGRGFWERKPRSCMKGQIWEVHSSGGSVLLGGAEVRERRGPQDGSGLSRGIRREARPRSEWIVRRPRNPGRKRMERWRP